MSEFKLGTEANKAIRDLERLDLSPLTLEGIMVSILKFALYEIWPKHEVEGILSRASVK